MLGGDLRDPGDRVVEAQPHQPVALDDVERVEVAAGRDRHGVRRRRHAHAATLGAERPAVVAAHETAVDDVSERQRRLAVRAAIGGGDESSPRTTPDDDVIAEQAGGVRAIVDRR